MTFRVEKIEILCDDPKATQAWYENLFAGHNVMDFCLFRERKQQEKTGLHKIHITSSEAQPENMRDPDGNHIQLSPGSHIKNIQKKTGVPFTLTHLSILTENIENMISFYSNSLGFEMVFSNSSGHHGKDFLFKSPSFKVDGQINLCLSTYVAYVNPIEAEIIAKRGKNCLAYLSISTPSLKNAALYLEKRNVSTISPIYSFGLYKVMWFKDNEGHYVELYQLMVPQFFLKLGVFFLEICSRIKGYFTNIRETK